ncbi:FkbM family methyltransferase [Actinomycetospora cinnamomea]|uniref:FkbM family methyltransferase n=1 Tax=Actinomycetospora cinnamomea TaxID=663609 RepID=A0A2U1FBH3_9PSEU|nr:FkbM family methyltransferase [Actinomycetospora cinnamomea]
MQIAGERYLVSTHDRAIGATAFSEGEFDLDVMEFALGLIEERTGHGLRGRTFVDVGANVGTATIPALARFGAARAVAVEPAPENVKLLRCNLISNGLEDRVITVNAALSDTVGTGTLEYGRTNWGDHRLRSATSGTPARYDESSREVSQVDVVTLDSLVEAGTIDLASVGVVWVDTQGHEGQVLAGARSVVAANVPVVIEYWPYGLRRANGLELLHDVVRDHYRMVVDLRASLGREEIVRVPADAVGRLEGVYTGTSYTDLLLVT